ncbi:hypothetical protein HK105_201255 [Polyrhizophydium stewartii]|uniref:Methylated-DNA--protein-cysteine methyltransferase n=1 Tax=Polyrhizophydium stewartii TaxID=2732419 RepID=A0ABR4NHI2_9FUNG|nr:hypothetical protein HK105_005895 [Polyrhizophydium stewartii]
MPTEFQSRVYSLCSQIPKGSFATYKDISDALHSSPRAVGQALKRNPFAPAVPCHRVLASDCFVGGFFGDWGVEGHGCRKLQLLSEEGLLFDGDGFLDAEQRSARRFVDFKADQSAE